MPKSGEVTRKLKQLSKGYSVKPPKKWFDKMQKKITRQYPHHSTYDLNKIIGGIWSGASTKIKKNIIKKYQV